MNILIKIDRAYQIVKDKYFDKKNTQENRHFLKYDLMYELGYDVIVEVNETLNTKDIIKKNCFIAKIRFNFNKDNKTNDFKYLIFGDIEYYDEINNNLNK